MLKDLGRLAHNEKGATLVEYALIIAGVALIAAATISVFGHKTNDMLATTTAVLPGAHPEDNAPIISGKIIETSAGAQGLDQGSATPGVGLDVNAITSGNNTGRLANDVGTDGNLRSLVLEAPGPQGTSR